MLASSTGSDEVEIDHLVSSILRVKGTATAMDVHSLNYMVRRLCKKTSALFEECIGKLNDMDRSLKKVHTSTSSNAHLAHNTTITATT